MTSLDKLLKDAEGRGISAAKIAKRIGVTPPRLSDWRTGKRPIPDDKAIKLAEEFSTTPFDISPTFNVVVLNSIKDADEQEALRLSMKRAYRYQLREAQVEAPRGKLKRAE